MSDLWLIRHGETEWSLAGRHTGRTDIALTPRGERQCEWLRERLSDRKFALVLVSPLGRARQTCRIAGYGDQEVVEPDLSEWNYGDYEGRTTPEIRTEIPDWTIWDYGAPSGESANEVGARADRAIARALAAQGDVALFAHAHVLRVVAARWLRLEAAAGRYFALQPASVSVLSHEREQRVIQVWNEVSHL